MKTRPLDRGARAAALAWVLWGCGGGVDEGASASAAGRVDACALVPKQEVESIVGASITEAEGDFKEHTYVKPVNYTASCMYTGERTAVILAVHYPSQGRSTSEQLVASITRQLHSSAEDDPSMRELYRTTEVRPVSGLGGPAAEYVMFEQTTLEARTGPYHVKVVAGSPEGARGVAARVIERLE